VEADLKYVGVVQRILEVRYSETPRTVLQCFWICPNLEGIPTMCKDANGVWLVKYTSRQQLEREPYIFPYNVKQVIGTDAFFSYLLDISNCSYYSTAPEYVSTVCSFLFSFMISGQCSNHCSFPMSTMSVSLHCTRRCILSMTRTTPTGKLLLR
jgi:hypothetical protein